MPSGLHTQLRLTPPQSTPKPYPFFLVFAGQLGDVMKESATIAHTFARKFLEGLQVRLVWGGLCSAGAFCFWGLCNQPARHELAWPQALGGPAGEYSLAAGATLSCTFRACGCFHGACHAVITHLCTLAAACPRTSEGGRPLPVSCDTSILACTVPCNRQISCQPPKLDASHQAVLLLCMFVQEQSANPAFFAEHAIHLHVPAGGWISSYGVDKFILGGSAQIAWRQAAVHALRSGVGGSSCHLRCMTTIHLHVPASVLLFQSTWLGSLLGCARVCGCSRLMWSAFVPP